MTAGARTIYHDSIGFEIYPQAPDGRNARSYNVQRRSGDGATVHENFYYQNDPGQQFWQSSGLPQQTTYKFIIAFYGQPTGFGSYLGEEVFYATTTGPPAAPATPNCYASRSGATANVSWDNVGSTGMQRFRDGAYIGDQNGSFSFSEHRGQTTTGYQVRAFNSNGAGTTYSGYSNTASVFTNSPPNVANITSPGNGAATNSTGSLYVAATVSDPDGANCLALFRWSTNNFASYTDVNGSTVGSGGTSAVTLTGLPINSYIQLRAHTWDGAEHAGPHEIGFYTLRYPNTPTSLGPTGARGVDTVTLTAVVSSPDGRNCYAAFETSTDNATWTQRNGSTVGSGGTSTLSFAGASNTTYYLRARAVDSSGYVSGYTGTVTYITNRSPGMPGAFTAPTSGQVVSGLTTITYGAGSEPDGQTITYFRELSTNGGSTWTAIGSSTAVTLSYDFSSVVGSPTSKLRVRSRDPAGLLSAYRESATFTIDRLPSGPTNVVPAEGAFTSSQGSVPVSATVSDPDGGTLHALFRWSTTSAFTASTDVTGTSVASGSTSTGTLTGLPRNSRIYLRTFTINGATTSVATSTSFFTDRDPTAPAFADAASRVLHPSQVEFTWTPADLDNTAVELVRFRRTSSTGVSEWWTGSAWTSTADTTSGGAGTTSFSWAALSPSLWPSGSWNVAVATRHSGIWSPYSPDLALIVVPYTLQMTV